MPDQTTTRTCTGPCGRTLLRDADHFQRNTARGDGFSARCKDCINAERRKRRRARQAVAKSPPPPRSPDALTMAGDALAELLAELPSAPRDPGAAERSRRSARAADKAVAELERPPFDAHELFLMMADGAGDVGALGGGLRRIGWTPDGLRPTPPAAPDPAPRKQPSRPRWRHSDSTILAAVPTVKTLAREVAEPLGYNRTETLVNRLERINARATAAGEVAPVVVSRSGNGNPVEVWRLLDVVAA